ncbi:MAG: S8 family serine peptidase, partial [Planctomycetota bacterium]
MCIKRLAVISSVLLLTLAGFATAETYKSDELLVKFKKNSGPKIVLNNYASLSDGSVLKGPILGIRKVGGPLREKERRAQVARSLLPGTSVSSIGQYTDYTVVKLPKGISVEKAVEKFWLSEDVEHVQPNYIYKLNAPIKYIPNDPLFSQQWALDNGSDNDIDAPEAWKLRINKAGSSVIVGIMDTGVYYGHPDLFANVAPNKWANMWYNPLEDNITWDLDYGKLGPDGNDLNDNDDDDNGYADDLFGWDFVGDDRDPCDENFHGTMLAGIIGALGNNGIGIAGVSWDYKWNVRMASLRVFNEEYAESTTAIIAEAIQYADMMGMKVINASWGSYGFDQALYNSISVASGILFVTSAGNDGNDLDAQVVIDPTIIPWVYVQDFYSPASFSPLLPNVISVMATDRSDNPLNVVNDPLVRDIATNYGHHTVDLAAPGYRILTTTPTEATAAMDACDLLPNYDYLTGTSGAAAHVSGAAAFMLSINSNLTPGEIKAIMKGTVDKIPALEGLCDSGGRLNLFNSAAIVAIEGKVWNKTKNTYHTTIQDAINHADSTVVNEIIAQYYRWYPESVDFLGKPVKLRSGNVLPAVDSGLDVIDPQNTIITGFMCGYPHFACSDSDGVNFIPSTFASDAEIKGFSITGWVGRAVDINDSSPDVNSCYIFNNNGGIYCKNSSSQIFLSRIYDNITGSNGAGIYCDINSPILVSGSDIYSNFTTSSSGGGIYCGPGSDANIVGSHIEGNYASSRGGGIYFTSGLTSPIITGSSISGNVSSSSGAGIFCGNSTLLDIYQTTISWNMSTAGSGGGIYCDIASNLNVFDNSNIANNLLTGEDQHGGGIYMGNATANILSSKIAGNRASGDHALGGGIYSYNSTLTVEDVNMLGNFTEWDGGGIYSYDSTTNVFDSIFNGNVANYYGGGCAYIASEGEITNCLVVNNSSVSYDGGGLFIFGCSPP